MASCKYFKLSKVVDVNRSNNHISFDAEILALFGLATVLATF
jgi:hypothetical protein